MFDLRSQMEWMVLGQTRSCQSPQSCKRRRLIQQLLGINYLRPEGNTQTLVLVPSNVAWKDKARGVKAYKTQQVVTSVTETLGGRDTGSLNWSPHQVMKASKERRQYKCTRQLRNNIECARQVDKSAGLYLAGWVRFPPRRSIFRWNKQCTSNRASLWRWQKKSYIWRGRYNG